MVLRNGVNCLPIKFNECNQMIAFVGEGKKPIRFDDLTKAEITLDRESECDLQSPICFDSNLSFSATLRLKRMSRKTFINKLSSFGFRRKEAKRIARRTKIPYASAYMIYCFGKQVG